MARKANFQSLSWFWDLYRRDLLDMNPPYQRRSVWSQEYKDFFVDTVLSGLPCPAIFVYEEVTADGISKYGIVDGKQRLSTVFQFAEDEFPIYEKSSFPRLVGVYFKDLPDDIKKKFWLYQFPVEYVSSTEEHVISDVFDRINRNVAKLTRQELRHARLNGEFITSAEELADFIFDKLGQRFPMVTGQSKRQMKDVELVAQLLLFIEEGAKAYSQDDLDDAFSDRDKEWEQRARADDEFKMAINYLSRIIKADETERIVKSRFRNQADFYSLFAAIVELSREGKLPPEKAAAKRLLHFLSIVSIEDKREQFEETANYFKAARSASNDAAPRRTRINIIAGVLTDELKLGR